MSSLKKTPLRFMFAILTLMLASLACSFNASTAVIGDAWLSSDDGGNNRTTVFNQDAIFYAQVDLRNAPDDTKVKAVWVAIDARDVDPNLEITQTEMQSGSATLTFRMTNDSLWPTGKYKVDLYLNDSLAQSLNFEVR
jgi:hypothetical protein